MADYKITKDGVFVYMKNQLIEGWEPCTGAKDLIGFADKLEEKPEVGLKWIGGKISADVIKDVLGTIREFPRMETGYTLYYNRNDRTWAVKCPLQTGSGGGVHFNDDGTAMPPGQMMLGTIHTHPQMQAFWSGTDLADQKGKFGIHMVFGLTDGMVTSSRITIFSPRGQYDVKKEDIFEDDVELHVELPPNEEWVATIKKQFEEKPDAHPFRRFDMDRENARIAYENYDEHTVDSDDLNPFQKWLVKTYGYRVEDFLPGEPEKLTRIGMYDFGGAQYIEELFDGEAGISADAVFLGGPHEMEKALFSWRNRTSADWDLFQALYTLNHMWKDPFIYHVHQAEDLAPYLPYLKILFTYLPHEFLIVSYIEAIDQIWGGETDRGDTWDTEELGLVVSDWVCSLMSVSKMRETEYLPKDGATITPTELNKAFANSSTANKELSWKAVAIVVGELFGEDVKNVAYLAQIYGRMQNEGLLTC